MRSNLVLSSALVGGLCLLLVPAPPATAAQGGAGGISYTRSAEAGLLTSWRGEIY
jgi:hypothetical protein